MGFLDPNSWAQALSSDPTGSIGAASISAQGQAEALALQKAMWEYQKGVQEPFVSGGQEAEAQLRAQTAPGGYYDQWTMDKFKSSVPYQTMMDPELIRRMNQGTTAQGIATGNIGPQLANAIAQNMQLNALQAQAAGYGQWTDAYNRLVGRANPTAAQQVAQQAAQYGVNAGQTMANRAAILGQGQLGASTGQAAARAGIGQGIGSALGDWLKGQFTSGGTPSYGYYPDYTLMEPNYSPNQLFTDPSGNVVDQSGSTFFYQG